MSLCPTELMEIALAEAASARSQDLPIAAVIFDGTGTALASTRNEVFEKGEAIAHAELLAIRAVGLGTLKRSAKELTLAVTLEPCPMCSWGIRLSGIGRVVFGAHNNQYGAAGSTFDLLRDTRFGKPVEVIGGVLEEECKRLLGTAFSDIRDNRGR